MNETLQTIFSARTIHGTFSNRDISDEDLHTVLSAAVRAPNASNRQAYSIVVISDREEMQAICGYRGSRALLFCVDYNRLTALAAHTGNTFDPDGLVSYVTGSVDAVLAAQTAALAAKSLGIDVMFTNGIHRVDLNTLYRRLDLPRQHCFPLILLILGYPAHEPGYLKGRIQGPGVIHFGKYHALTASELDSMVAQYDDPASHLGLNDAWSSSGYAHYLDWFFQDWTRPGFNPKEAELAQILSQSGFLRTDPERAIE